SSSFIQIFVDRSTLRPHATETSTRRQKSLARMDRPQYALAKTASATVSSQPETGLTKKPDGEGEGRVVAPGVESEDETLTCRDRGSMLPRSTGRSGTIELTFSRRIPGPNL